MEIFNKIPMDMAAPWDPQVPDACYASVGGSNAPLDLPTAVVLVQEAAKLGLKGLRVDDSDYTDLAADWEIWFVGTAEAIMMLSLKYKDTIILTQEKMDIAMKKAKTMADKYPGELKDYCYMLSRITKLDGIVVRRLNGELVMDVSHISREDPKDI